MTRGVLECFIKVAQKTALIVWQPVLSEPNKLNQD